MDLSEPTSTLADQDYERGNKLAQAAQYTEAAEFYLKAANRNIAPAQCELGFLYAEGLGVLRDDHKATRLFRLAAIQGYAKAQFNLAFMITKNRTGSDRSILEDSQAYEEMLVWYRKAAVQDYQPALYNIAVVLERAGRISYQEEGKRWRNNSAAEAQRWMKAYMHLSDPSHKFPAFKSAAKYGPSFWNDAPDIEAEIERGKRLVEDKGDIDSAAKYYLDLYSVGVIRARNYLDQIAAQYNLIGQMQHAAGAFASAEKENLKSGTLYAEMGNVAAAGPVYASLAAVSKKLGDRKKMCDYAYCSRDLLAAADNQSMLQEANRFINENCK